MKCDVTFVVRNQEECTEDCVWWEDGCGWK